MRDIKPALSYFSCVMSNNPGKRVLNLKYKGIEVAKLKSH